jgi:hypothetical protein
LVDSSSITEGSAVTITYAIEAAKTNKPTVARTISLGIMRDVRTLSLNDIRLFISKYFDKWVLADLSIIEFIVYGLIGYSSMLMLIVQTVKAVPSESSGSIVRSIYLIPGIIACLIIAGSGDTIITNEYTNTIIDLNATTVWTEDIESQVSLSNPIWVTFHYLLAMIMLLYVIIQILTLFLKLK